MATSNEGQVLLADDHLALIFEYNAEQVAEIKRVPGAKWDRIGRVWRVPVTSLDDVRDFAARHRFWVSPDVAYLDLPQRDDTHRGVTFDDDWIWLGFPYDRVWITAVKTIPGVTWDKDTKAWQVPVSSIDEALDFCRRFDLAVPPELLDHAADVAERTAALIHASRATDAEIEVGDLPLMGYQRAGVAYALDAKRCFIADDMGLGKTIQSIATIEAADAYPVAVICPPSLVLNWKAEYAKWLPDRRVAVVTDRKTFPERDSYDVVVLGWSNIAHWVEQVKGHRSLIADESHYAKSFDAKRTKAVIKAAKTIPEDGYVLALTGTPVTNKPAEYAAQLEMLGRIADFGGRMGFYRRYCNPPEAPIWMADFTHRSLGEIQVGDKIIGWDGMDSGKRELREAEVLAIHRRNSPIVKVTLASGRVIRCTPDHQWISGKQRSWVKGISKGDCFVNPQVGRALAYVIDPVDPCPPGLQRDAGWLGGMYDGEGTRQRIAQSKSYNPEIFDRLCSTLTRLGFDYTETWNRDQVSGVDFTGGKHAYNRFLAWCQPTKDEWLRERVLGPNFRRDDIVSVEPDGEGEVISMTTSTGNYVAWGYASKNCNAFRDKWGHWHFDGHSNLDELNEKLRSTCYVRRVKEQVLKDLPPVVHAPLVISGSPGAMTEYRKAEANIVEWLVERAAQIAEELGVSVKSAKVRARMAAESNEHLVRLSVLRRLAARAKMEAITEWVEQVIAEDRKVVIAAHHREIVDELAHRFGGLKIQGGQDVAEVEEHKAFFMNEPCGAAPTIVLSIQAAKTGHTLTAAQDVLFVELPWNWADVEQTYSRCHRIGQQGSVTATYLLCAGTVDEEIYDLVQAKRSVVAAATDGGEVERNEMASKLVGHYLQLGLEKVE